MPRARSNAERRDKSRDVVSKVETLHLVFTHVDFSNHRITSSHHHPTMPIRPFPFPLSVGTDIVHIDRIRKVIDDGKNPTHNLVHLARRILTRHERVKFWNRYETWNLRRSTWNIAQFLAGR